MQRIPIPENWLNQYNFTPCAHTIAELEAHLIDHYHASRIVPNERQLTAIQEAGLREHLDDILLPEAMDIAMYRFALKSCLLYTSSTDADGKRVDLYA